MHKFSIFAAVALLLPLVGCNAPVVTAVTQATIDNAALIALLSDPNLTSVQKTEVMNYAQAASVAVGQVSIILAAGGTAAQMSLEIASALAPVASPLLPGLPADIVTAIGYEARDIQAILTAYGVPVAATASSARTATVQTQGKVINLSSGDIANPKAAHAKVVLNEAAIAQAKK
jgi:hypothetical protein